MQSEDNRARAEAWYDANISLTREKPSLDFDEESQRMREKLAAFENQFVRENGERFLSNMNAAKLLVTTPFESYSSWLFRHYLTHVKQMNSPNELLGGLVSKILKALFSKESEPVDLEDVDTDRIKAKEFYEIAKSLKAGGDYKLLVDFIRSNAIESLMEKPELIEWTSKLFEATLCSIWTSYEVLASDLWESLVNHSIEAARNASNFESNATGAESKKIDLNILFRQDLNLNGKMGGLLKDKFDFTGESGIRAAYQACFRPKAKRQNKEEMSGCRNKILYATEQKRHLILHCGGVIDRTFVDKMQKVGINNYQAGDRLNLSVIDLEEPMEEVFREGCKLLELTEKWVNNQPS